MKHVILIISYDIFVCCQQISLGIIIVNGTENKSISGYIFGRELGVILHMIMVITAKSRIC
jgi:hypothetical protein